uniref:Ribosomal protein L14 n=1 Tax=Proteomonas sulcata TaxID=77928 RepID=A0A2P1G8I7_9CRYP|nr:ribosomal protein L14 [Proteomonas sulcata]AVM81196.1 ribosomal protein L14 [Proteomonas sulcata]
MIQQKTLLKIADNSGAKIAECIKVYKEKKLGSTILVAIKERKSKSKLKKGGIHKAIIIRLKKENIRKNSHLLAFDENAAVLLNLKGDIQGTRLIGPVTNEIRKQNLIKILSLAAQIL